jgi:hypothetical protein
MMSHFEDLCCEPVAVALCRFAGALCAMRSNSNTAAVFSECSVHHGSSSLSTSSSSPCPTRTQISFATHGGSALFGRQLAQRMCCSPAVYVVASVLVRRLFSVDKRHFYASTAHGIVATAIVVAAKLVQGQGQAQDHAQALGVNCQVLIVLEAALLTLLNGHTCVTESEFESAQFCLRHIDALVQHIGDVDLQLLKSRQDAEAAAAAAEAACDGHTDMMDIDMGMGMDMATMMDLTAD